MDIPSTPYALYIPRARLIDPSTGRDEIGAIYVDEKGQLAPVPAKLPPKKRLVVIDEPDLTITPGLCDVHVHYREPGMTEAEDLSSGASSSANGGFTRVVTMPNTNPATDSPVILRPQVQGHYAVSIYPSACATIGRAGRFVADLELLAASGASAFTDDGAMISESPVMEEVMTRAKALDRCVMDHAVVPGLAKGGIVRDCEWARNKGLAIFPPEAEIEAVRADIALCRKTGCALHIQHISCAGTVALIREAQAEGLPVTGEATPHHLALSVEDIPEDDGNYRMNPPLGSHEDVAALRQGVLDGTLSIFATDHAPHLREAKARGFKLAPFGVIGSETAAGVTWTVMVRECGMSPLQWAAHWVIHPNRLIHKPIPTLEPGTRAEFTIFDFETPWTVDPAQLVSKSINTPFAGMELYGKAKYTYRHARIRPAQVR